MSKRTIIFGLAAGLVFTAAAQAVFAQITAKEMAKLQKGKILTSTEKDKASGDRIAKGQAIFQAPSDIVWQVLTNYQAYPEFLSDIKQMKVVKREGDRVWVKLRFRSLYGFPDFKCTAVIEEFRSDSSLKIQMEEGNFNKFYASWKLTPLDQTKILAEYRLYRYVGWWWLPFIPDRLTNESIVSNHLEAFRKQIKLVQMQNSSQPDQVIKPFWRKSIFKGKKKEKPKQPATEQKENKTEERAPSSE